MTTIDDFCDAVGTTLVGANSRFRFLIGVRNKMVALQKTATMGTDEYSILERRKNMWMEMLTRSKEEVKFLTKTLTLALNELGYDVPVKPSVTLDLYYDVNDVDSMVVMYNDMYNITTTSVYSLTAIAVKLLENVGKDSDIGKRLCDGMEYFDKTIKTCIRDNYYRQLNHIGSDIMKEEVEKLFNSIKPSEVDKILIK